MRVFVMWTTNEGFHCQFPTVQMTINSLNLESGIGEKKVENLSSGVGVKNCSSRLLLSSLRLKLSAAVRGFNDGRMQSVGSEGL